MPFALDSNPELSALSEAVNYLLGNFTSNMSADPSTGQITGPVGEVTGYLYKYMAIKYADSYDGSVNFSNLPANRQYYGIRNSNSAAESDNPSDYIWYRASGGFGLTKSLWYICTGGRQIQFAVATSAPDAGWVIDPGSSIDLDVVTSGNIPVIAETFVAYFTPTILQVPRSGDPLTPVLSGITPIMYATDKGSVIPFVDAQTDTAVNFTVNTWRIGNSSTTGYGDISVTNLTIGNPTDAGDYAQWPAPSAMSNSPAYITVPVRYKNSLGDVSQAGVATLQLVYVDPGLTGQQGSAVDINGYTAFVQNAGGAFTPASATLSAVLQNITSPTYSWTISGATPTSSTASSVVVTPTSTSTGVSVSLTVDGSNIPVPITRTMNMPVVYDGAAGEAGANGVMSAFPTIYIWTGSSVPPTRPSTTSTYTWGTGAYTAPTGWSTTAPSNTIAGNYLWSITIPLNTTATTTTSTLDWTNTSYPIRAIAYNGVNGANGTDGTDGTNGVRTAVLEMYKWSASTPTTFPSGISTYTWSTGQFTAPSTTNGWSLTPPASVAGQTLWICRTVYADNDVTATTNITWSATAAYAAGASGTDGATGANGTRTAFLEVYKWSNATPTLFPSGNSTYTWATGAFTAPGTPNGWSLTPGSSTPGYTLYACSVRYADTLTTATSTVAWNTTTAYAVGAAGSNGTDGTDGTNGTNGTNGAATYVITRVANDSSAPSDAEVSALLGRNPVAGDICTVSYNNFNNAVVYRYVTSWTLFQTYITGSLIVQNTITGDKIAANTITGTNIAGTTIAGSNIIGSTITGDKIAGNTISASNMIAGTITAASGIIADAAITTAKIGTAQVDTLQIAGQAVTVPVMTYINGTTSLSMSTTYQTLLSGYVDPQGGSVVAIAAVNSDLPTLWAAIYDPNGTLLVQQYGYYAAVNLVAKGTNAGTYTLKVRVQAGGGTGTFYYPSLVLLGAKR